MWDIVKMTVAEHSDLTVMGKIIQHKIFVNEVLIASGDK
jgi:hypothetical protein